MKLEQVIALAELHVNGNPKEIEKAQDKLNRAKYLFLKGNKNSSKVHAVRSLAYSVGIFHKDYIKASK